MAAIPLVEFHLYVSPAIMANPIVSDSTGNTVRGPISPVGLLHIDGKPGCCNSVQREIDEFWRYIN